MSTVSYRVCSCGCGMKMTDVVAATPLTADEVEKAIEYIHQGWTQHVVLDFDDKVCSIGALNKARYGSASPCMFKGEGTLSSHVSSIDEFVKLAEIGIRTLSSWNDEDGRTRDEVEDKFVLVAKKLRDVGR